MKFLLVFLRAFIWYRWKWSIYLFIFWSILWECVCKCWGEVLGFWVWGRSGRFGLSREVILVVAILIHLSACWSNNFAWIARRKRFRKARSVRLFTLYSLMYLKLLIIKFIGSLLIFFNFSYLKFQFYILTIFQT